MREQWYRFTQRWWLNPVFFSRTYDILLLWTGVTLASIENNWSLAPWSGPVWTSSHQCTSWPFCALDGLRFFIQRQMRFITIHFFLLLTTVLFLLFFWVLARFSPGPDLPPYSVSYSHKYCTKLGTLSLSLTDIPTSITSYPIDLATVLTTYPTNIGTLLITYLTNLTIVLTTYITNLVTVHTQRPYWHKYFTNLVTLIR